MAVFDFSPFAEERVGFVEKKDRAAFFSRIEQAPQVFLRLADVLVHDRAEIDAEKVEAQLPRQDFGCHGFPCAAAAGKQGADPQAALTFFRESPIVIDLVPLPDVSGDLAQQLKLRFGQHQFIPSRRGFDSLGQVVHSGARLNPASVPNFAAQLSFVARTRTQDGASGLNVS